MVWFIVVLTGVCGSGKSTVGRALAYKEVAHFVDGDDYHSSENVRKMNSGQPLIDADRLPWLRSLHGVLYGWTLNGRDEGRLLEKRVCGVLACSALKKRYRDILTGRGLGCRDISERCVLVQLMASLEVLSGRVAERSSHFMPSSLVSSQLDILEPLGPDEGICLTCPATSSVEDIVTSIQHFVSSLPPRHHHV